MGVRFPVGIGRAARGVRSGYSLRFSDKLVVPSQKKQKKGCDTPVKRSVDALRDGRRRSPWPLEHPTGSGENRRERGLRTGVTRVSEADHPPTVRCRPCHTHWRTCDHQSRPILSRKRGRERKRRQDRIDCRSWTFDRESDRGNVLMIRFSVADPSCACSRTNISVRCPKPSKGVW